MKPSLKLNHIILISFIVLACIVSASSVVNYINHRNIIIDNFANKYIHTSQQAREHFRVGFDKLQHDFVRKESLNIDKLNHLYELYGQDSQAFDVGRVAQILNQNESNGEYQVGLINKNYVVEKSSYDKDVGYDLGQQKLYVETFDKLFDKTLDIDISPVIVDSSSMQFKRYVMRRAHDGKYLLQVAYVLNFNDLVKDAKYPGRYDGSLQLFLANGDSIQPVIFGNTLLEKRSLAEAWEQTKEFFRLMKNEIKIQNQIIPAALQKNIDKDTVRPNEILDKLFENDRLHYAFNWDDGVFTVYSITNGLFNKGSENKLIVKTQYPIAELQSRLQDAFNHFAVPLLLSLVLLALVYLFVLKFILNPLLHIINHITHNRFSDENVLFVKEINSLQVGYNGLHGQLNSEIRKNVDLLAQNKRCIADTVHQIRNPLANILMNAEMIKNLQRDDSMRQYIDRIDSSINMLSNSYDDLAYYFTRDSLEYKPGILNISEFLENRVDFFETIAEVNHRRLELHVDNSCFSLINETELERIIDNNISNAIKYGDSHQAILISLTHSDAAAIMSFSTQGKEILNKERVFEEGYRENDGKRGLGLGLHMVKGICEKYAITYHLSYLDGMNVFTYEIPLMDSSVRTVPLPRAS